MPDDDLATPRRCAALALAITVSLAGCTAPEEPEPPRPVRPAAASSARPSGGAVFVPAPTANRTVKAPEAPPVLQVDGLTKK